jgi:UDP-N-acetylglucosamine/UDP-N-acetylgalactosamine diphosphorylase
MSLTSTSPADLEERKREAQVRLASFGQGHVFDAWDSLTPDQKASLLGQVDQIDWAHLASLHQSLVVEKRMQIKLPDGEWRPAAPLTAPRPVARDEGLRILKETEKTLYGLLVVAGGKGSGLKFDHPKGLFPATPLSAQPLYQAIIEKSRAAARVYGQPKMYPIVFMLSDDTYEETERFFDQHAFFGEPDRILLARQSTLPVLDRRPGRSGRAIMKSPWEIQVGGAGHGDAFDHTLQADENVLKWLEGLGVRYMQFLNVDNLLNPVGDPYFVGEHVLSEPHAVPGRAHISVLLVPKTVTRRMGNIIQYDQSGQAFDQSVDYGLIPDVDAKCHLGHASLQIVTVSSLSATTPIPFMVAAKEVNVGDNWIPVWKFERSSNNKDRYGALIRRESEEVFASIKKRSFEAAYETPASATRLQAHHWRRKLLAAGEAAGVPYSIPESTVVELPWDADLIDASLLHYQLERNHFPKSLRPDTGYLVRPAFQGFEEIDLAGYWKERLASASQASRRPYRVPASTVVQLPLGLEGMAEEDLVRALEQAKLPHQLPEESRVIVSDDFSSVVVEPQAPASGRRQTRQRGGRRWDDRAPDAQRVRAVVAAFNNNFEDEPDLIVRAPGRNTAIGDHQDYPALPQDGSARSHTIAWASQKNVIVAARRRPDRGIKLIALNYEQQFTFSLDDLEGLAHEASQGNLPDVYGQELYPWAMSVMALLYSAKAGREGVRSSLLLEGADFVFEGNVPLGAGQSSSAAYLVAMSLACNDLFGWGIPRTDLFTLADLARAGEHEEYSPFIRKGRCGYLDQITSLAAVEGQALKINHGNYRDVEAVDLRAIEEHGYYNVIVLSGLNRSLGETDYGVRVEELEALPALMNSLLQAKDPNFAPKTNIHQFTPAEWKSVSAEIRAQNALLADRAQYIFEEEERTARFVEALRLGHLDQVLSLVQASGHAMSMEGPYKISGRNKVPLAAQPVAALDLLRTIVLKHAGPGAAARMIGGGGAGPVYLLIDKKTFDEPSFRKKVNRDWQEQTGLTARFEIDPPAPGAEILWRRPPPQVLREQGLRRIETYRDCEGNVICRLVDGATGVAVEVIPSRGTIRTMTARIGGYPKAILYNPELKPNENGASPYLGPWINRIKDGRARFRGQTVNLMTVPGVRDDGDGHALHGLMTRGWLLEPDKMRIDETGIVLVSSITTSDYSDHEGVHQLFGPARTELIHRLDGDTLHIESMVSNLEDPAMKPDHRIPVLAAVHPWFLLHPKKHEFAEITLPARRHRWTWKKAMPRLKMIPLPYVPALPIPGRSRHNFFEGRRLGRAPYDDTYSGVEATGVDPHPIVRLKDWFRDVLVEVGVVRGYDEFTLYTPGGNANCVCLEPQISSINALGGGAPIDAKVPTVGPGETYKTHMFIRVSALSERHVMSEFASKPTDLQVLVPHSSRFPVLLSTGMESGPLVQPEKTATHKDAIRVFYRGKWHIYGTGHEMKDPSNPPPGHRPHRGSIMFHLIADREAGPYLELNPPVLSGKFPKGIYEAPTVIAEGDTLHMFAQTTYYRFGGTIEHFVSTDGHYFSWANTAIKSVPGGLQGGVYDVDAVELPTVGGRKQPALVYSGFSREGGRDDRPDPRVFIAFGRNGWDGPFPNGKRPILSDKQVPWHNSHDPANPYYEWGLEGAQLMPLPNGELLMLCVAFEKRPGRDYMAAQRLLFALYDSRLNLTAVSNPILPIVKGWEEYGHGSMMIDAEDPTKLRMLYQARPENIDKTFRDTNTWRLFEALFDISRFARR